MIDLLAISVFVPNVSTPLVQNAPRSETILCIFSICTAAQCVDVLGNLIILLDTDGSFTAPLLPPGTYVSPVQVSDL